MWRLQGPAGLQVRLVGACRVGTGGISSSLSAVLQCSLLLPPYAGALWGRRVPLLPDHTLVASPALFPTPTAPTIPTYRIQAVDRP